MTDAITCGLCTMRPPNECLPEHKMEVLMSGRCSGRNLEGSEEEASWDEWDEWEEGRYCTECYRPVTKLCKVRDWNGNVIDFGLCYHCARDLANCVPASAPSNFIEED